LASSRLLMRALFTVVSYLLTDNKRLPLSRHHATRRTCYGGTSSQVCVRGRNVYSLRKKKSAGRADGVPFGKTAPSPVPAWFSRHSPRCTLPTATACQRSTHAARIAAPCCALHRYFTCQCHCTWHAEEKPAYRNAALTRAIARRRGTRGRVTPYSFRRRLPIR